MVCGHCSNPGNPGNPGQPDGKIIFNVGTKESSPGFLFLDDWNPITRGSMTTLNNLLRSSPTKIP